MCVLTHPTHQWHFECSWVGDSSILAWVTWVTLKNASSISARSVWCSIQFLMQGEPHRARILMKGSGLHGLQTSFISGWVIPWCRLASLHGCLQKSWSPCLLVGTCVTPACVLLVAAVTSGFVISWAEHKDTRQTSTALCSLGCGVGL